MTKDEALNAIRALADEEHARFDADTAHAWIEFIGPDAAVREVTKHVEALRATRRKPKDGQEAL